MTSCPSLEKIHLNILISKNRFLIEKEDGDGEAASNLWWLLNIQSFPLNGGVQN